MKQKIQFTAFFFFLPVLQRYIITQPLHLAIANLKFEFIVIIGIITLLFIIRIATIIYFWVSIINWICCGFKLKKLIPCIISFAAIFCLDYSINAIINNSIKRIKNRIQRFPNAFVKRNTQVLQSLPLPQSALKN